MSALTQIDRLEGPLGSLTPVLSSSCYMNSTLQCLSATFPLARFFRGWCCVTESLGPTSRADIWCFLDGSFKRAINTVNPLGTKGDLAKAFATLVSMLWEESYTFLSPVTFKVSVSPLIMLDITDSHHAFRNQSVLSRHPSQALSSTIRRNS